MPNNNFDLAEFVRGRVQVTEDEIARHLEKSKLDYVVISALYEKAIMDSILSFPNTAQSKKLQEDIALGVLPILNKISQANQD
jgi:hypothetical protein|tara:strand:- start:321 stop:569 length:249 start_codon:yes stop_codon:yes gene_type:complete